MSNGLAWEAEPKENRESARHIGQGTALPRGPGRWRAKHSPSEQRREVGASCRRRYSRALSVL